MILRRKQLQSTIWRQVLWKCPEQV